MRLDYADTVALTHALKGKQIDYAQVGTETVLLHFRDGTTLRIKATGSVVVELLGETAKKKAKG
jgi:hypothetical protein